VQGSPFPFAEVVNHLLADLRRGVRIESGDETAQSLVPLILRDLSVVLEGLTPAGQGFSNLNRSQRQVFELWEQIMAQSLGLARADAVRIIGQMSRRRVRDGSDFGKDSLPGLLIELADNWHLLTIEDRRHLERHVRDASQAQMLGFANGFLQNEVDQFPMTWADLLIALGKCLAVRIAEEMPGKGADSGTWKEILGPFSEESMRGAKIAVEHNIRKILGVLSAAGLR
jgi:hypothetical protein